jgi:hypothetical protein
MLPGNIDNMKLIIEIDALSNALGLSMKDISVEEEKDEGLGSLEDSERFGFGLRALKLEHNLLGLLGLLLEDRLIRSILPFYWRGGLF